LTTIKYEVDGKTVELEVEDRFATAYLEIDTESKRNDWKHDRRAKRHYCSLEQITENGYQIESDDEPIGEQVEQKEKVAALRAAIKRLSPKQQELIRRVYINGEKQSDIADKLGIGKTAVNNCLQRALAQLKKILENF